MCIDIVEICFGIANGQISSIFDIISFQDNNLSKSQWIFTKLDVCIDIVEIWFWISNGQTLSIFDSYLPTT